MTTTKEEIFTKISNSGSLPPLPEVLVKLMEACEDSESSLTDIAAIISKDTILNYKVLNLVNSAYYGVALKFNNIQQAVIYLGSNTIKNLAVTTTIQQVFSKKSYKKIKQFNITDFWVHSLHCATLSKHIAQRVGYSNYDEAYLSGMLHDIGRLLLITTFPEKCQALVQQAESFESLPETEKKVFGINHNEVGAWFIQKWQLPSFMADSVRYHHETPERIAESFPLIKIVYYANLINKWEEQQKQINVIGDMLFDFDEGDNQEILADSTDEVKDVAEEFGITLPSQFPKNVESGWALSFESEESESIHPPANSNEEDASEAENTLVSKVKNISMLTPLLESLVSANEKQSILGAFEQCVKILFNIQHVLFFLPEKKKILLQGVTSPQNHFYQLSQDMTLPLKRTSSQIVSAYNEQSLIYVSEGNVNLSLADRQILTAIKSENGLIVPISAENVSTGVIILGLPDSIPILPAGDRNLLRVIAKQVALRLHIDAMDTQKAEEIEAERLAAITMTAKKFAHEVNNPLGIISNYLASLEIKLPKENNVKEDLNIIHEEIKRISTMVKQLDLLTQTVSSDITSVNISELIENLLQMVSTSLLNQPDISIIYNRGATLPTVKTSPDRLKQILLNLIKNGYEAMEQGGNIEISTLAIQSDFRKDGREGIEIIIADNGPGLPEEVKENLYKPFITTKGIDHSGLGLSIAHKAVEEMGGEITCSSTQGEGTTFSLFLPLEFH